MFVAPGAGEGPAPKKDRKWLWGLGAWLFWFIVADELVEAALAWLVATGGYGFSNAIIGLLTLGGCFIGIQRLHVKHRRLETEGDPDPLPAPYDYQTQAQGGVFAGWAFGIITWVATLAWLIFVGVGAVLTFWPILGTTLLWAGRMEMAHARVMDGRRGQPPAPVDQD